MDIKKSFLALILIIIFLFAVLSGCSSNTWTNETTTTEQTTLSEEEILKNKMVERSEGISNTLIEKYGYQDVNLFHYLNFQEFINELESNPSDFFFAGTDSEEIVQGTDEEFYTNEDVLDELKDLDWATADYIIGGTGYKKDWYRVLYIPIKEKSDGTYEWWHFDSVEDKWLLRKVLSVATERCDVHYID